jgi:hypothetical protein
MALAMKAALEEGPPTVAIDLCIGTDFRARIFLQIRLSPAVCAWSFVKSKPSSDVGILAHSHFRLLQLEPRFQSGGFYRRVSLASRLQ